MPRVGILVILLLATEVQFFRLDARTFHGDELGSVFEAEKFGRNANSLPYFAILRGWLILGRNEFWLRSLSVMVMVVAIALTYAWIKQLSGESIARVVALLLATSPFLVVYSQQVRFYSVGLASAGLSLWTMTALWSRHANGRSKILWVLTAGVAILGLLMNALLVLGQAATLFVLTRWTRRAKIVTALTLTVIFSMLISSPLVRQFGFGLFSIYTNAPVQYDFSRGIALTQLAKIPLTFFFFIFGESVHPLTLAIVLPGILIFGLAFSVGAVNLSRNRRAFWLTLASLTSGLLLLYLVLDPLAPPSLQGAAPRYLIFLLPFFYWIVASGTQNKLAWLTVPLLATNLASLALYWVGDWAYTDDRVNWHAVTDWVAPFVSSDTILLLDGQAQPLADYYFPSTWQRAWLQSQNAISPRVITFSYNWHPEARGPNTLELRALTARYELQAALTQYPLFIFVYDRKPLPGSDGAGTNGWINSPNEIYGIEYQDLQLPVQIQIDQRTFNLTGAFGLPRLDGEGAETIPLDRVVQARKITMLSQLINTPNVREGAVAANLKLIGADGQTRVLPLRVGYETAAWDATCRCRSVYTWHKRLALVGFQSYPDAWHDFNATIFATELNLDVPFALSTLEIERVTPDGKFYVWGIAVDE